MRKFTIMLADDEKTLLMGMLHGVPWEECGFNLVAVADNGQEALELIQELHPDVLISDIRMPFMDGLELAEHLRKNFINIKIVILSGFDDFNYAQKAIRNNVSDYLLKPVNLEEFTKLLKRMYQELEKEMEERLNRERQLKLYNESLPVIKHNLLAKFLSNNLAYKDVNFVRQLLEKIGIFFYSNAMQVIMVDIPEDSNNNLNIMSITDIINDMLSKIGNTYFFKYKNVWSYFVCLEKEEDMQAVLKALESASVEAEKLLEYSFYSGVGLPVLQLGDLYKSGEQAMKALEYNKLQKDASVTFYNDILLNDNLHLKQYIDENFTNPELSIDSICQEFHISASHFTKLFKRSTGTSFLNYLTNKRIAEAENLLLNTDLKSREIGERVGYTEPNYFSYVFKRQKKLSPANYRKQMRNNNK